MAFDNSFGEKRKSYFNYFWLLLFFVLYWILLANLFSFFCELIDTTTKYRISYMKFIGNLFLANPTLNNS